MRLASLWSGGKDSCFASFLAQKKGNELKYLVSIFSDNKESFMFHTSNIGLVMVQAETMGIKLITEKSSGEKEKELLDLKNLLKDLDVEGIVCGGIASEYQKKRLEKICKELGLKLLTPLWGCDEEEYLHNLVKEGFEVIISSVSAEGFTKEWLGRKIDEDCVKDLLILKEKHGINLAFEGGEACTTVLDCPMFKKRIQITEHEIVWDEKTSSGLYIIKDAKLVDK